MAARVEYQFASGVARITLSSPETGNALGVAMLEELSQSLQRARREDTGRVITLLARGKHFCRGLDFSAAFSEDRRPNRELLERLRECFTLLTSSPLPVIASVQGDATGGGVGLVAACDLVLASPQATFMLSEVIVGLVPAFIAPFLLRRVTPGRLRSMALGTRGLRAVEAREYGLVDELTEEDPEVALRRQLQRLLRSSPKALAESKRYVDTLLLKDFPQQVELAIEEFFHWMGQPEVFAGVKAFSEGDTPSWFQKH